MPRISKAKLLSVIDEAQKNVDTQMEQYEQAREQYQTRRVAEWHEKVLPLWGEFATLVKDRVKRKKVITEADASNIFDELGRNSQFWYRFQPLGYWKDDNSLSFTIDGKTYGKPHLDHRLASLRSLLETLSDDEITTSSLADLGWRKLDWLYTAALKMD